MLKRTPQTSPDDAKFREVVLYIAHKSEGDPRFSGTKLNKLLYYADFRAYRTLGAAITGQPYQKLPNGPAPIRFLPLAGKDGEMVARSDCRWEQRDFYGYPQDRLVPMRGADLKKLSPEEVALIDEVVEEFWEFNASQISEHSHQEPGWAGAPMNEEILYQTSFVQRPRPLSRKEIDHGLSLVGAAAS